MSVSSLNFSLQRGVHLSAGAQKQRNRNYPIIETPPSEVVRAQLSLRASLAVSPPWHCGEEAELALLTLADDDGEDDELLTAVSLDFPSLLLSLSML